MHDFLTDIPISDITTNPNQPRHIFNEQDIQQLAESIANNGLIQPIIVKPSEIVGYELIAGERRLRAHQYLNKENIKAIVTETSHDDSMKQALIENIQRTDLTPIEEAKAYQTILEKLDLTHQDLATILGKSRPYISNQLRLLQLPDQLQEALQNNHISPGHARLLLPLPPLEQQKWFQIIIDQQLSVHQLEKRLKKEKTTKHKQVNNPFQVDIEKTIQKSLGLPIRISGFQQKKGHISITFNNEEEFNNIINKLT